METKTSVATGGGVLINSGTTRTLELNEARSRYVLIDPALRKAGWNPDDHAQVLREVPVDGYLPPVRMQLQFAALVERHERLRATQREALRQAEHLFQTLLHQAFSRAS